MWSSSQCTFASPLNTLPPSNDIPRFEWNLEISEEGDSTGKSNELKTVILSASAEGTGLNKKEVASVFDELGKLIGKSLINRGAGTFKILPPKGVKDRV